MKHLLIQMFRRSAPAVEAARRGPRYLRALSDLSFDVAAGEVIGIIGRNGAGKSTLLKVLARVLHPTSGRVVVRGRIVSMLELGVGFAPSLTVRQNIHIQGRLAGISGRRIVEAEDAILEESGLRSYADGPLRACPGGSGVQLAFAAMVGFGADVILADEVLAVGDSAFRRTCEDRVRAAASAGASVLFVSHDMAAIRRICSRVIWIDRGRLVRSGPPDEVVEAYTSELLAGRLRPASGGDGLEAGCALLDLRLLDATGGQVGALQLSEPGYIDCVFRINPGIAAVVEMTLYHRKNVVFSRQSAPFTSVVTSTFRAGLLIPADFLNEQQYQVRVRLLARRLVDIEVVSVAEERLEFSVLNPHPERSVWHDWPGARRGLISPRLSWSVQSAAPGVEARVAE
jgi:lipopolysaccharide transport system ATP-binding protein